MKKLGAKYLVFLLVLAGCHTVPFAKETHRRALQVNNSGDNSLSPWHGEYDSRLDSQGRSLAQEADLPRRCGPLTKELVQRVARDNTVLVTVVDKLVWHSFGPSYVENIQAANITYWLIAALDPETSLAMGAQGITQCFNAPQDRMQYKGVDVQYKWGSHHWTQTTWNKVHVMKAVYELGVHVVHSDTDVVWFSDPLPFFHARLQDSPPAAHVLIATDAVATANRAGDLGMEANPQPYTSVNTGMYFMRQWPGGLDFWEEWLSWQGKDVGHDQDGFNSLARGFYHRRNPELQNPVFPHNASVRVFQAAYSRDTSIAFLPASMFANTYTYVNTRLWEKLGHPLYAVHWVWGGKTLESKRQAMRDAMKFHDPPHYYSPQRLMSFELEQMQMPATFNSWFSTERMIRFHAMSANHQLQQTYYAFAIALIANRTLVMPRFLCYCSKNWYQTQQCRINYETATTFPFVCALSQLMRVKKLQQPFSLPPDNTDYSGHRVPIREYSFLENPKVPDELKRSYLEVVPSSSPRPPGLRPEQLVLSTDGATSRGYGQRLTVAAPLEDWELRVLLAAHKGVRVLHFPQPARTLAGFSKPATGEQFDTEIQKRVAYWCCRSPPDAKAKNLTDRVQLVALPPQRHMHLPRLEARASYLHATPELLEGDVTSKPWCDGVMERAQTGTARLGELLTCIGDGALHA